ncbi:lipopolysaccharide kinase InaA family protein [Streptomyces atriruber]|uniref:lipopolysaccharide kinase InaA family protein n=1 Tax=Streptomyces atriruber TaxID=545121 RepID=UPI0006E2076D|nr:lipopolysaccharide kinase InaA family protein [Streptomyces atriruber]
MTVPVSYARPDQLGDYRAHRLGAGGQGVVYGVPEPPGRFSGEFLAYKEYLATVRSDGDVLYAMVVFLEELGRSHRHDRAFLSHRLTWPLAMIYTGSRPTQLRPSLNSGTLVVGFLMQRLVAEFQLNHSQLGEAKPAGMEFLLNEDAYTSRIGLQADDDKRLRLLADLAATVTRLHRQGVIVGDLSPKNVLFRLAPTPRCLLIDCDSMRLRGKDVLPQVETEGWEVPEAAKATTASDVFKFGLIATRLFNRDQHSTDLSGLRSISTDLATLADRSRNTDPRRRPQLADWHRALERARSGMKATQARPQPVPSQQPQAPQPTPRPSSTQVPTTPAPSSSFSWGGCVVGTIVLLVVVVGIALLVALKSSGADSSPPADTGTPGRAEAPGAAVDYSQVVDEPAADEVADMFARFYGAINTRHYGKAMTYYDPKSGVVDRTSASSRREWTRAISTTKDTRIVLAALSTSGARTFATVSFRSRQDAGYGPASNPDDTCDDWKVTYQLTHTKGYRIYKAPRSGVSHRPC